MTRRVYPTSLLATPAGPWLRCFLSRVILGLLLALAVSGALHAQIAIEGPLRLSHVAGVVVNTSGKPVANAKVSLVRNDRVEVSTETDPSGRFQFDHVSGRFVFRIERSENAAAAREIVVADEIVTHLERKKMYVILGPGACTDECSSVLTSKRDFERALRKNSRH